MQLPRDKMFPVSKVTQIFFHFSVITISTLARHCEVHMLKIFPISYPSDSHGYFANYFQELHGQNLKQGLVKVHLNEYRQHNEPIIYLF